MLFQTQLIGYHIVLFVAPASEMSNAEMLEKLAELEEAARLSKEEARKSKIASQVSNVRSAGNK